MTGSRRSLAETAVSVALKTRKLAGCDLASPICIYDVCERLGVSVLFQDIPSMEGFYVSNATPKPTIIVSSLRPTGRRALTCGHELGHHVFHHGTQWDELSAGRIQPRKFDPDEFQADVFSATIQMPKGAVTRAMSARQIVASELTPAQAYTLSCLFGVSYAALIIHLERTLGIISMNQASILSAAAPKTIREQMLGQTCPEHLVVVDLNWRERAIDCEAGDLLLLPAGTHAEGACLEAHDTSVSRTVLRATSAGISRVGHRASGWSAFVRISRKNYVGRAKFRFDEELLDEE